MSAEEQRLENLISKLDAEVVSLQACIKTSENERNKLQRIMWKKQNSEPVADFLTKRDEYDGNIDVDKKKLEETQKEIAIAKNALAKTKSEKKTKDHEVPLSEQKMRELLNQLPEVSYFKDLGLIPESISIQDLIKHETSESIAVINLLKMGNIDDISILNDEPRRLRPILRDVSLVISNKFSETWKQEPLQIDISKEGDNLVISFNDMISMSSSPKERSEGFQWFLSFIAGFSSEPEKNKQRQIILLDEPALRLHPKGQKDLLKVIERLSESNQFIYTTHSPFLVNRNFPQRIRLLEKHPQKGTIINNKPYANGKTRLWEPLKSSIGICLGDLFSLGETNLIVEGISDEIVIAGISNKFAALGEPFLDLNEVTIVPASGADCEEYLAKFALSEGLASISLFDNDAKGKRCFAEIQKEGSIQSISINELKKDAVTLEDLVPETAYVRAVNSFYSKFAKYREYVAKPQEDGGIIERLHHHFENVGLELDKVSVVRELMQQVTIEKNMLPDYEPFKKLFGVVNEIRAKNVAIEKYSSNSG